MVTTPGRGKLLHGGSGLRTSDFATAAGRLLDIGRVPARFAVHDFVLARLGRHHELVRELAAHDAGVGFDRQWS